MWCRLPTIYSLINVVREITTYAVNGSQSISSGTTEFEIQTVSNLINIVNRKTQSPQLLMYSFDTLLTAMKVIKANAIVKILGFAKPT